MLQNKDCENCIKIVYWMDVVFNLKQRDAILALRVLNISINQIEINRNSTSMEIVLQNNLIYHLSEYTNSSVYKLMSLLYT